MTRTEIIGNTINRTVLAVVLMVIISAALRALFQDDVPSGNRELISMIIGALLIRLTDVYAYYYNSSADSAQKNRTIETLATTAAAAQGALAPLPDAAVNIPVAAGESVTVTADPETKP